MNEKIFREKSDEYRYTGNNFTLDMDLLERELERLIDIIADMKKYCVKRTTNVKKARLRFAKREKGMIRVVHIRSDGTKAYMGEDDLDKIHELAQKNYYLSVLGKIKTEENALRKMLAVHRKNNLNEVIRASDLTKPANLLISPMVLPYAEAGRLWQAEPYVPSDDHPENLKYQTLRGELVRSKSEANLANTWAKRGYYYKYEKGVFLEGYGVSYPDFTVFDPKTGKIFYFEHFGMVDNPDYVMSNLQKLIYYAENGIKLNVNLFCTFETLKNPLTQNRIDRTIDEIEKILRESA